MEAKVTLHSVDPDDKKKRDLTTREKVAAANLERLWNEMVEASKQPGRKKLVQKEAADTLGFGQSMLSHYVTGRTALGLEALLKFSMFLHVRPIDIDPEFEFANLIPGELPEDAIEVAVGWLALSPNMKKTTRELILSARND